MLTCFLKAFNDEEGVGDDVAEFVYMPTGGPFVVSCFENVMAIRTRSSVPGIFAKPVTSRLTRIPSSRIGKPS